ncbi:hypothetical protein QUF94_05245 [Peribacillus sp. NJ4]|uniref:hypothetical protein n=1 Tax=Peribacillus TaxID=2675229 RepID=UPI0025A19278|nr:MULTISPECIES: hypothetical protein [unclassified Peribacillus]MDM5210840.1 hypothetical protein [Peribacillus sp. NJ4]MDM5221145.1 hypothetical protein [Peribacillus sp. NJ11]
MTDSESKLVEENNDEKHNKLVGNMEYTKAQLLEGMNGISEVYLKNSEEGTSETSDK